MSYDISLSRKAKDSCYDPDAYALDDVHSMNWLRNPFGLCTFAEDNVGDGSSALWHVCNDHAYDKVKDLDRAKFLMVVREYWERIRSMEKASFYFTPGSYDQFAKQYPKIMPPLLHGDLEAAVAPLQILIPVEKFQHAPNFGWRNQSVLQYYKDRFQELVELATTMQDPEIEIYISK